MSEAISPDRGPRRQAEIPRPASEFRNDPGAQPSAEAVLDGLPVAVYAVDAEGYITYYNSAAARLWGCSPVYRQTRWCGCHRVYWPDGSELCLDAAPIVHALKERRAINGFTVLIERPDGTRIPISPAIAPIFDDRKRFCGAVNVLREAGFCGTQASFDAAAQRLAAIVESSDDAILAKDLDGVITDWNKSAEKLFGYTEAEAIGRPVTMLIPADRANEEPGILARIRKGERIDHYETVRQRKDGSLIDISITVSPVRDSSGRVVGASKIARDITERRRAQEQKDLLLREMNHRIKNLFALASGVVALSARSATTPRELADAVRMRLAALARAHALTVALPEGENALGTSPATFHKLVAVIAEPYAERDGRRMTVRGYDFPLSAEILTPFALLLHEFATNAAKYGALSAAAGEVEIDCHTDAENVVVTWRESGGPGLDAPIGDEGRGDGFGTVLLRAAVEGQLGGSISRQWQSEGLVMRLTVPHARIGA